MSMYPSIESLTMDNMAKAQTSFVQNVQANVIAASSPGAASQIVPAHSGLYSSLYQDLGLDDYMGISLALAQQQNLYQIQPASPNVVATTSSSSQQQISTMSQAQLGIKRAEIKDGVRQAIVCKGQDGKIGFAVQAISKGVFVACVWKNSPASLAGIRVGDQIIQINGTAMAGLKNDAVYKLLREADGARIEMVLRDRPFERIISLAKNSTDHLGFVFKNGKITSIAKDTSAARNGLLVDHHFLEVNGQNVIGLKDEEISKIIQAGGDLVTLTIMPSFIYETMVKNLTTNWIKKSMDHSIPDF